MAGITVLSDSRPRPARRGSVRRLVAVVGRAEGEHVLDAIDARNLHLTQLHAGPVSAGLEVLVDEQLVERVNVRVTGVLSNLRGGINGSQRCRD